MVYISCPIRHFVQYVQHNRFHTLYIRFSHNSMVFGLLGCKYNAFFVNVKFFEQIGNSNISKNL